VAEAAKILSEPNRNGWLADVDRFLKDNSWDNTFNNMAELVDEALENIQMKTLIPNLKLKANV
jgi:UDP-galactopyranose mutase